MKKLLSSLSLMLYLSASAQADKPASLFVNLKDFTPNIAIDLKYLSSHNFVGKTIDGYYSNKVYLTKSTALALQKIESELQKEGLGLKIFDAYRPQSAVDHFKRWAKDINDTLMRREFYPRIDKRNLFKDGFIASKSGHSRGSTVDLTIISLKTKKELDMGTAFDFFGEESGHTYTKLTTTQLNNRIKLKSLMEKYGFKSYSKEWWHYTLLNEPYKQTYFNFPIK